MSELVYVLCAVTSLACALLLARAYRANRSTLLLSSTVCFVGLFINNVLLVIDFLSKDHVDLLLARDLTNVASVSVLLVGLILRREVTK